MGKSAAQQSSGPEGEAAEAGCVSSGEAWPCMETCSEKFSAPFALVISWVSQVLSPSGHTHIENTHTHCQTKLAFFSLCNMVFLFSFAWEQDIKQDNFHSFYLYCTLSSVLCFSLPVVFFFLIPSIHSFLKPSFLPLMELGSP